MPVDKAIIAQYISKQIAENLQIDLDSIKFRQPLFALGVTSLVSEEILMSLSESYKNISSTLLFEHPTIEKLSLYLATQEPLEHAPIYDFIAQNSVAQPNNVEDMNELLVDAVNEPFAQASEVNEISMRNEDIAIIGISGKFPQADNPDELWRHLIENNDCVTEVPKHRWDVEKLFSTEQSDRNALFSKWGGFIDDIEFFDPSFFKIPYREAELMDPQQKLFLQCGWSLMENAGYGDVDSRGTDNIGVYTGVTWNEFSVIAHDAHRKEQTYKGAGSLYWSIPNRLSYALNLKGPSVAIDSACSSSLVAIQEACMALQTGKCEMAIAGGVNLNLHPNKYLFLSQNHFLSSEGKCRSFGEGGDGYVPAEGVAAVLLKPLSKALADRDYVYGVIKAAASNHGGKVTGYTVPNPTAHTALIRQAVIEAGVDVNDISYIECHGTGTYLGDPIEITGLTNAFSPDTEQKSYCAIGSIKSNIGHLEAAAGVAGLIKVVLSMRHGVLPASLHATVENQKLTLKQTPFYIVKENTPWIASNDKLLASISSFGAGGSNAHVIIEKDSTLLVPRAKETKSSHILVLSAQSQQQLSKQVSNLQSFLADFIDSEEAKTYQLGDIAFSLIMGRSHFQYRIAVQGKSFVEIEKELRGYLAGKSHLSKNIFAGQSASELDLVSDKPLSESQAAKLSQAKWAEMWTQGLCHAHSYYQLKAQKNSSTYWRYPLPTYPFLKERSWITEGYPLVDVTANVPSEGLKGETLHPLVDKNISTIYQQKFEKNFSVDEFVLADHLVNDVHVIPGVCHLEMVRLCAKEATQDAVMTVYDVWYYNVISVDKERTVEIEFTIDDETLKYHIHDPQSNTVFSRGKVAWSNSVDGATEFATVNIDEITTALDHEWDINNVYDKFVDTGIIQKESFRVLTQIGFNQFEALSTLTLPVKLHDHFDKFVFHPALMDGAVQTAMMHVQFLLGHDVKILPFHFSEVTFIAPLEHIVYVHCRVKNKVNKEFDLTIYNAKGQPLVKINSFILKEMKSDETQAVAELSGLTSTDLINSSYYAPTLIELPVASFEGTDRHSLCFIGHRQDLEEYEGSNKHLWVKNGDVFSESEHGFVIRYHEEEDYQTLVQRLIERQQLPQLILYANVDSDETHCVPQVTNTTAESLFLLAKSMIPASQKLDWVVFADGQTLESDTANLATYGFFKTLKVEKPGFMGRVIQLEHRITSLAQLRDYALKDIATQGDVVSVRYHSGKRYFTDFANVRGQVIRNAENKIRVKGVYLITGGMGGIGLVFAKYLIDHYSASVYLTGRSLLSEDKQILLQELNQGEGQAVYMQTDVTKVADVQAMLAAITEKSGELHGIIHSAGTIEDSFILRKNIAAFRRVVAPKTSGVVNLDWCSRELTLDFFCLFSSVTAILGNLGQCDYGYANAFEDNFVKYRNNLVKNRQRTGHSISINWPYWKDGGMQLSEQEERQLKDGFGLTPLANEQGIAAFHFALSTETAQLAVLEGDQEKIASLLGVSADKKALHGAAKNTKNNTGVHQQATAYLCDIFAQELKIPREKIDVNASFERYGFDSIIMIDLINVMDKKFKALPKTLFFEYQTIEEIAQFLCNHHADSFVTQNEAPPVVKSAMGNLAAVTLKKPDDKVTRTLRLTDKNQVHQSQAMPDYVEVSKSPRRDDSIAIIGISGQFPQADNVEQFWQNLQAGQDCVSEIPTSLWDWEHFYRAGKSQPGKSYSKWGGFIRDVDKFDASFFNMSPKEAEVTDPQERLFLQCATSALQDAGYTADTLATINAQNKNSKVNPVGVFVGVMWGDYQLYGVGCDDSDAWTTPRSFYWGIANRVSYFHNFTGPSMAIDTACSSSLSAIHLACESIKNGEVEVAIAGGVNLTLHPNKYNLLSEMQFLSTDGRCRSFGEGGDGYVPGDGVGALVLKPLSQAEADGDHIYGVIRGSALNHGGKASGFTVPNPIRQAELIKNAIAAAGISPRHISYVEAHGTGTSLGDPVEMIGLKKAYQQDEKQWCAIGSVKSNIGHLEAAAGVAALVKVLLQMKHQKLVPSLHSSQLNSNIDFSDSPFYVQQTLEEWRRPQFLATEGRQAVVEIPRMAGISSFGAGGSNAHIIVEEYYTSPNVLTEHSQSEDCPRAIVLSATNEYSLNEMARSLAQYLVSESVQRNQLSLVNIAYTLQTGREHFDLRCVFVVNTLDELVSKLNQYLARSSDSQVIEQVYQSNLMHKNPLADLFADGSEAQSILEKWIEENHQEKLSVAWVSGVTVDWAQLYVNQPAIQRVSLPTYAFNKKRYWTSLPEKTHGHLGCLHPLLDENISTMTHQQFRKTYQANDSLLVDHKIRQVPTLPGAAFIEMALQAAIYSTPFHPMMPEEDLAFAATIKNVSWVKSITAFKQAANVQVELVPFKNGYIYEITKASSGEEPNNAENWLPCGQGEVYLESHARVAEEVSIDVKSLQVIHREIDLLWLSQQFIKVGYEFGHSFDVYEQMMGGQVSAVAIIDVTKVKDLNQYVLSPVILDAAFRTCLAITGRHHAVTLLQVPVELETLSVFAKLDQKCVVYAKQVATAEFNATQQITYDIDICTVQGRLLAQITGFKTQVVGESTAAMTDHHRTTTEVTKTSKTNMVEANILVENYLKSILSSVSKVALEDISSEVALEKYGINSVMIMTMNDSLVSIFGELSKTLFYEYQNIRSLSAFFVENYLEIIQRKLNNYSDVSAEKAYPSTVSETSRVHALVNVPKLRDLNVYRQAASKSNTAETELDIAIIGMSGRFPEANSIDELWEVLSGGKDCIREVPIERWDHREFYDKDTLELCKSSSKWGGFIDGYNCFDASLFNVLPTQAKSMDPQERLFLQCVWSTLEDAGYTPSGLADQETGDANVGVFAGTMWNHFDLSGVEESLKGNPTVNFSWDASIANRASYFFNFTGPSMMFDAACSTSLLAIHQACESIRKGECRAAIAGGVNLSIHPYKYQALTQMQMLSAKGRCHSFGAEADGYVPGEGVASVLLKPLSQALADNDHIYGVIKGGAINHNGKTNGFTVPNPIAQEKCFRLALEQAKLNPEDISYFEAHGTGTRLGDPIEFNALNNVFKKTADRESKCALGSIKSNIGHLEGAAGATSLIKVLLQLKHKKIAPSLHSKELNPNIDFANSPLYVPQQLQDWHPAKGQVRRAAISSLGAGGANTFLVVEELSSSKTHYNQVANALDAEHLFVFSAKSLASLRRNLNAMEPFLRANKAHLLAGDVAYTLQIGRIPLEYRLAVKARSLDGLADKLKDFIQQSNDQGVHSLPTACWFGVYEQAMEKAWYAPIKLASQSASTANNGLSDVAKQWLVGGVIDWQLHYQGADGKLSAKRVPLPLYQFEQTVYWPNDSKPAIQADSVTKITDLLDINMSNFVWQKYRKTYSSNQFYIESHQIGHNLVIPGTVLLEMAIQAFLHASHPKDEVQFVPLEITALQWLNQGIVNHKLLTEIRLHAASQRFEVASVETHDQLTQYVSLFAGEIRTFEPTKKENQLIQNLDDLLLGCTETAFSSQEFYAYFDSLGLHYGDYFQVTQAMYTSNNGIVVKLQSTEQQALVHKVVQPSILDAALRATLLALQSSDWQQLLVPHSIEMLQVMRPLHGVVYAQVQLQEVDREYQTFATSDISLFDEQGQLCLTIVGFRGVAATIQTSEQRYIERTVQELPAAEVTAVATPKTQVPLNAKKLNDAAVAYVKRAIAQATGMKAGAVKEDQTFESLAIDSITIVKLNKIFEKDFSELSKTLFFECNTAYKVAQYIIEHHYEETSIVCGLVNEDAVPDTKESLVSLSSKNHMNVTLEKVLPKKAADQALSTLFVATGRKNVPFTDVHNIELAQNEVILGFYHRKNPPLEGPNSIVVHFGQRYRQQKDGVHYTIRKNNDADLATLLHSLHINGKVLKAVAIFEDETVEWLKQHNPADTVESSLYAGLLFLQQLVKILTSDYAQQKLKIVHFHQGLYSSAQPQWEALTGFANALSDINNRIYLSTVALHPAVTQDIALFKQIVATELIRSPNDYHTIEYDGLGRRSTYELVEAQKVSAQVKDLPLQNRGVYLITGGAGSLGLVTCRYLVELAQKEQKQINIALLGRSLENDSIKDAVQHLNTDQASVFYLQVDIGNEQALIEALAQIRQQRGELKGIVHCAGVSAQQSLLTASAEEFVKPLAAKCKGTLNLDYATSTDPLDFYLLYSSITSHIGDFGAASYATANSFQNNFAEHRNYLTFTGHRQGLCQAIAWPLWALEGINQNHDVVQLYLDDFGMQAIDEKIGVEVLRHCWASQLAQVGVYYGQKDKVLAKLQIDIHAGGQIITQNMEPLTAEGENAHQDEQANHAMVLAHQAPLSYQVIANSLFSSEEEPASVRNHDDDIAIIGLSGVYPGADSVEALWRNLQSSTDSITEIPIERWDYRDYYSEDRHEMGKVCSKWGGFINNVDHFDSFQFNFAPREAQLVDPQERIFLQTAFHCIEDAGYCKSALKNSKVGVYVGAMWGQYQLLDIDEEQKKYGPPGSSFSAIANQVSYYFDFHGPSLTLDTMCSSSLTAIHLARKSILSGECDYALAGGVNLTIHPDKYQLLARAQFISSDGHCRSFGEGGTGYVPSEGSGAIFLKRLSAAIRDGDHIYGVIKSTAINHGGRTNAFTVPNPVAIGDVVSQTLEDAAWDPRTVSYVEAHGTGTPLGDPIEINALSRAFRKHTQENGFCAIGSIKSNIGHLESASGIAGMTKILLQMKYGEIVPSLYSQQLNKNINFTKSPFVVPQTCYAWDKPIFVENGRRIEYPRRAGLSSFGAGGSNSHILIEEYVSPKTKSIMAKGPFLYVFSAKSAERLTLLMASMYEFVKQQHFDSETEELVFLANFSFTLQVGRQMQQERLAIIATTFDELALSLASAVKDEASDRYLKASVAQSATNLESILDEEQKQSMIASLIAKNNLLGLAKLWISSLEIEWQMLSSRLFSGYKAKRISMPATPLIPKKCWIKAKPLVAKGYTLESDKNAFTLHPLVDQNISTLYAQKYFKQFSGHEFYLKDHLVGRTQPAKVLPGVAYLEMAKVAAESALGQKIKGISNLIWGAMISVDKQPKDVVIDISVQSGELQFEVHSENDQNKIVHSRGDIMLFDEEQYIPAPLQLNQLMSTMKRRFEKDELYNYYQAIGFHYGPSFRVTDYVCTSATEAISHLTLPSHVVDDERFYLHPALMDGVIRTCLVVMDLPPDEGPLVPFSVESVELFSSVRQQCYAWARMSSSDTIDHHSTSKFDVTVTDEMGHILVEIKGLVARKLSPEKRLNYYSRTSSKAPLLNEKTVTANTVLVIAPLGSELDKSIHAFSQNNTLILVRPGDGFAVIDHEYIIDPSVKEDYLKLFASLKQRNLIPNKVIHGLSMHGSQTTEQSVLDSLLPSEDSLELSLEHSVYSMVYLFQAFMENEFQTALQCVYLHSSQPHVSSAQNAALSAFAKSLLAINHRFSILTLGVDQASVPELPVIIENELNSKTNYNGMEIHYLNKQRFVGQFEVLPNKAINKPKIKLVQGGAYIITGGLGQLGQIFARYLLKNWQAKIVLTGRSPLNTDLQKQITSLCDDDARIVYLATDLSDSRSVTSLFRQAQEKFTKIEGVIHSAGVVDDKTIMHVQKEDFHRILQPKIHACIHLMRACKGASINNLILFSSVSSLLGDLGGGSYAYANRYLDQLATLNEQANTDLNIIAIDWPLWQTGGMKIPEREAAFYHYSGMTTLSETQGIEAFEYALNSGLANIIVAPGDALKIAALLKIEKEKGSLLAATNKVAAPLVLQQTAVQPKMSHLDGVRVDAHDDRQAGLHDYLIGSLSEIINCPMDEIEPSTQFQHYGLNSVLLMEFNKVLSATFAGLAKTVLFEYDTINALADYLTKQHPEQVQSNFIGSPSLQTPRPAIQAPVVVATAVEPVDVKPTVAMAAIKPQAQFVVKSKEFGLTKPAITPPEAKHDTLVGKIAVIGMSGEFPASPDLAAFWQNILSGQDCITRLSGERWVATTSTKGQWAGLIDKVYHFEAPFFNLSAKEVEAIDPQARKMMKISWQAIEDAGYNQAELHKIAVGIYMGVMNNDFTWNVSERYINSGDYLGYGAFGSDIANRISTMLNVTGPSLTVETACASSSTAIHMARKAILHGECQMAIAGGVNLTLHHGKYLMLDSLKLLSPDGKEKTFDDDANGLVPSEGVGAVVLKSLQQAIEDGDHIYGVISGSAIGHSGIGPGEHLPSIQSLEKNFVKAIAESGISPTSMSYLECHGAGTALGDPIELKALSNSLRQYTDENHFCAIGTKANFGHLESASGICSLVKVLLSLQHEEIAPCAHFKTVNHVFDDSRSPFYFPTSPVSWDKKAQHRVAGISSFGLGGSNAFLVVESFENQPSSKDERAQLLVFSANSIMQLHMQVANLLHHCAGHPDINLADVAYTLQTGRKVFSYKVAFVASTVDVFVQLAQAFIAQPGEMIHQVYLPNHGHKASKSELVEAMAQRNFDVIARHWIAGGHISWLQLHIEKRQRCSLPTYPFIEEEYRLQTSVTTHDQSRANALAQVSPSCSADKHDYPQAWFNLGDFTAINTDAVLDSSLTVNIEAKLTRSTLEKLGEISCAYAMTPVQKFAYANFNAASDIQSISFVTQGTLELTKLRQAWQRVVRHFEILRSVFVESRKEFFRIVLSPAHPLITTVIHCAEHQTHDKESCEVTALSILNSNLPYQLSMRSVHHKKNEVETLVTWQFANFLIPNTLAIAILDKLAQMYHHPDQDLIRVKDEFEIQEQTAGYVEAIASEQNKSVLPFWQSYLHDGLQTAASCQQVSSAVGERAQITARLNQTLVNDLQLFTQKFQLQPEVLFVGAWALIQARLSKAKHAVFATDGLLQSTAGTYARHVPLLLKTAVKMNVAQWLTNIQAMIDELRHVAFLPMDVVYQQLGHRPNLPSAMVFEHRLTDSKRDATLWSNNDYVVEQADLFSLLAQVRLAHDTVSVCLHYDKSTIAEASAQQVLKLITVALKAMIENAERNPAAISLKTDDEKRDSFWKTMNEEEQR